MKFDVVQCNYTDSPVMTGADIVLAWSYRADCRRGARQLSFCVDVSENPDFSTIVYTSSTVISGAMRVELPVTVSLQPATLYFWRVTSQDSYGETAISQTQLFETTLLDTTIWERLQAHWITCGTSKEDEPASPVFSLDIDLPEKISFARAYVYGLGWQHLMINGLSCSDWLLAPPNTKYDQRCLYETYAITDRLIQGRNRIDITLGNGYDAQSSRFGWRWLGPKGVKAIFLVQSGNHTDYFVTDKNWLWRESSIRSCDIFNGEVYDAQIVDRHNIPVQVDDDHSPIGRLLPNEMPHVTICREIEPIACWPVEADTIFDFGVNAAGFVRIQLRAPRGHEISLQFSELIAPDGSLTPITNRLAKANDRYICSGEGVETWQPMFTYHGFRYVAVSGLTEAVSSLTLVACLISADLVTTGLFRCSDAMINRIHQNMLISMRSNFVSIPTDCPCRDERTPCQMDSQLVEEPAIHNFNMNRYYRKWLDDIAGEMGYPDWYGDQIVLAWRLYWYYGDIAPTLAHYDKFKDYLDYLENKHMDFIWTNGIGDWCNPNDNTWPTTNGSVEVVNTCLFYNLADTMKRFAVILGKTADAQMFRDLAERIRQAFLDKNLDSETGRIKTGRQTEQLMPLYYQMIPPEREQTVVAALVERIRNDGAIDTGGYGTMLILPVLAKYGHVDIMDRLLHQSEYPGFGWQIANGASSLWEQWAFEGIMHSHNHGFIAGMDASFYQVFAGIKPTEPGYRRFTVQPVLPSSMTYAQASLQTASGLIEVAVEKVNQGVHFDLSVPQNTEAMVYLPVIHEEVAYALYDGERRLDLNSCEKATLSGLRYLTLPVVGGIYRFRLVPEHLIYQR